MKIIRIKNKLIGPSQPTFIVAELSGNHNKSLTKAKELVLEACKCGVDAIKLQTYTPDTLTIDCSNKWFQVNVNPAWKGKTLYQLYKETYTPWEWHAELKEIAEKNGVMLFSTPFDETAVDFLEKMNVPAYKIASFEIGDIELLKKVASTKKPIIISRGMASIEEINLALSTLRRNGAKDIIVLHCVSSYPASPEDMNLKTIPNISKRFKVISGLSDHTLGISTAIASVALGAAVIEKHLTLKRVEGGPDSSFSLEPGELKELVESVRDVERALGRVQYNVGKKEVENIVFKRSIFAVKAIAKGEIFTRENIKCIRPGYGLAPKYLPSILGKKAKKDIKRGTPICR